MSSALAGAIARAGWAQLLPGHRTAGEQPTGTPRHCASYPLQDGLSVAVVEDDLGATYPVPLVSGGDAVRRARPGDGAASALVASLAADSVASGFEVSRWHHERVTGERPITVDQTNESIVVGEAAVVKWVVRADAGPHPAPVVLAELDRAAFAGMPRPWGALQWRPGPAEPPRLVALVVAFLPGAEDGWTWFVDDVRADARTGSTRAHDAARSMGTLVADFHLALAGTARPVSDSEVATWRADAEAELDRALGLTDGAAHEVLLAHVPDVRAILDGLPARASGHVLRVHGDLHVGQVLRVPAGADNPETYDLTDFDGNPVVAPSKRLRLQPAALDVAGLAQSLVHAGLVVHRHHPEIDGDAVSAVARDAADAFVVAYLEGCGDLTGLLDERLLVPFAVRQVCREFVYAATHLRRWSYVPEAALPLLLSTSA